MYIFKKCQAPKIFNMTFEKPTHKCPTQFKYKKYSLTKHSISVSGPKIWNEFLTFHDLPYPFLKIEKCVLI